jgi:hypothetical protein
MGVKLQCLCENCSNHDLIEFSTSPVKQEYLAAGESEADKYLPEFFASQKMAA